MAFDLDAALRIRRHDPGRTLARRPDAELPYLGDAAVAGSGLLLDTCVYIDQMRGTAPDMVEQLIDIRIVNHSMVAVQELMFSIGALAEDDRRTPAAIAAIGALISAIPAHRRFAPDADVLARAAVYAGLLARRQGYARDDRMKALQDCVLLLQAEKLGLTLLSANAAEFDILLQIRPTARVLLYRPVAAPRAV
ncbi:DNA-binding protein [Aureimonas sp. Leaf454]|uniref:type II toxin-antitoxin system VapC family toxin n=1 Tax=Aureimonas sp. Leaf454 TaxID=1736381 RepID=UPI0006FB8984|nr:hypothetical protein [Aureimonas sp. Leaf454]KQT53136.1 DNA-binding protein [Aureimonas sp. Leaf454]